MITIIISKFIVCDVDWVQPRAGLEGLENMQVCVAGAAMRRHVAVIGISQPYLRRNVGKQ